MWTTDYGCPALDFVNTRFHRLTAAPEESLTTPSDLLSWLADKGLVDRAGYRAWAAAFRARPAVGAAALREALAFREALYRIFWSVTCRQRWRRADLDTVNQMLADGRHFIVLSERPRRDVAVTHEMDGGTAGRLLAPVALSAAHLLGTGELRRRVHRCANDECALLFFDRSRNGTRRWCEMALCGSVLKMRRYRARASRRR
jgi:predicted RNA-binding Zn ribbon-like protein